MPLKLFGALLLTGSGILTGAAYAAARRRTILQVEGLCAALEYMRARIDMLRTPVPDIFTELAQRESPCAFVFQSVCRELSRGESLESAMREACTGIEDDRARQTMMVLCTALGKYEADEEIRLLNAACAELTARCAQLGQDYQGKAPLVRKLTAAAGICLAVLLL